MSENEFPPVIFVDIKQSKTRFPLVRPQRWYWVALSADNFRKLGRSSEMYTNMHDAIDAALMLFGDEVNVFLRRHEIGNLTLRQARGSSENNQ